MIYTLTLNPALDYHIHVSELKKNMLNLPNDSVISTGGKGINVSKVLRNLDIDAPSLGFVGGFTGSKIIEELNSLNISTKFITIDQPNRINIKIKQTLENTELEIAGISPIISSKQENELIQLISNTLKSGDFLVCSGSIPSSLSQNIYKKIASSLKGIKVVLDTRGDSIKENLHNNFLIKPNIHELEDLLKTPIKNDDDIIKAGRQLLDLGVENIIVSLGKDGSLYMNNKSSYRSLGMTIKFINTVGAGDSMVAGFIYAASQGKTPAECYKFSIATACATITSHTLASKEGIKDYLSKIEINKI